MLPNFVTEAQWDTAEWHKWSNQIDWTYRQVWLKTPFPGLREAFQDPASERMF